MEAVRKAADITEEIPEVVASAGHNVNITRQLDAQLQREGRLFKMICSKLALVDPGKFLEGYELHMLHDLVERVDQIIHEFDVLQI